MLCWAGTAAAAGNAVSNFNGAGERAFAPTHGEALPPIGFLDFCRRSPSECRTVGGGRSRLRLSEERWRLINEVNGFVNRKIMPASDLELHGVEEHWTVPAEAGDCEDYVLLKKRYLEGLGFPAETLLITVVLDEQGNGHAVLLIRTDSGDFVLDNRRDEVKRWADTSYHFLKRQSQENPMKWIALTPKGTREPAAIAGGN